MHGLRRALLMFQSCPWRPPPSLRRCIGHLFDVSRPWHLGLPLLGWSLAPFRLLCPFLGSWQVVLGY